MALGLRQLRYFLTIADAGAMSRAAESLNIAQSALSHHVAELEMTLGVKLFERRARGVTLTAAGRRLQEHASALLSALSTAEQDVRTFAEAVSGPVSLGLSHTAVAVVALDVMQVVRASWPGVHLTLAEGLSLALIERVFSGAFDLALAYNPPKDARLSSLPLLDEDLYLVGLPSLIGKSSGSVAFVDIPQGSVLGLHPVPASRAIIQAQILRNQIASSPTLEIDSLTALRRALEAGLGCAILARATILADLEQKRFHSRRIVEPTLTRTLNIVSLADRPQTRAFVEVRKSIIEAVRTACKAGRWPAQLHSQRGRAAAI
jgi:LysR family transcriptional regulator, nitrogen assimilation regulatory protein